MRKRYDYQLNYAREHATEAYNSTKRGAKAKKTIAVLQALAAETGKDLASQILLDIGASAGFLTKEYALCFGAVYGLDIDREALAFAQQNNSSDNIRYILGDSMNLPFPDACIDTVTCSQVYEHVPDASRLMDEIFRVLKPGGGCYFAAGNRFVMVEMHYNLPLLSAIPKPLAHLYLRVLRRGHFYYENHRSYWGLKKLVRKFEVTDFTFDVIRHPDKYDLTDLVTVDSLKQRLALRLLPFAYWLCPTYIWVLTKPVSGASVHRPDARVSNQQS